MQGDGMVTFECIDGKSEKFYAPCIIGIFALDEDNVTMLIVEHGSDSYRRAHYVKGSYADVFRRIAEVLI